jgi:hypothetical protein
VHFFGYFLCASKESNSSAMDGGRNPAGMRVGYREAPQAKTKIKMDPGLRRDDEVRARPAATTTQAKTNQSNASA